MRVPLVLAILLAVVSLHGAILLLQSPAARRPSRAPKKGVEEHTNGRAGCASQKWHPATCNPNWPSAPLSDN